MKGWALGGGPMLTESSLFSPSCDEYHRWWRQRADLQGNQWWQRTGLRGDHWWQRAGLWGDHGQQCPEILKWKPKGLFHEDHICHSQECPQLSPRCGDTHIPSPQSHKRFPPWSHPWPQDCKAV